MLANSSKFNLANLNYNALHIFLLIFNELIYIIEFNLLKTLKKKGTY